MASFKRPCKNRVRSNCWKCWTCFVRVREAANECFSVVSRLLVDAGAAEAGLDEAEYCSRHVRLLSVRPLPDEAMRSGLTYSVPALERGVQVFMNQLRPWAVGAPGLHRWWQLDPYRLGADVRLELRMVLFDVPMGTFLWDGPGGRSLRSWSDCLSSSVGARYGLRLLQTGFWGASESLPAESLSAAAVHVGRFDGLGSFRGLRFSLEQAADLGWLLENPLSGRRLVTFGYSPVFRRLYRPAEFIEECAS